MDTSKPLKMVSRLACDKHLSCMVTTKSRLLSTMFSGSHDVTKGSWYSTDHRKVNINQLKVDVFALNFRWKKLQVKS